MEKEIDTYLSEKTDTSLLLIKKSINVKLLNKNNQHITMIVAKVGDSSNNVRI